MSNYRAYRPHDVTITAGSKTYRLLDSEVKIIGGEEMSCYDIVKIPCPKCGELVEAQTKSGECNQKEYLGGGAPARLLAELDEEVFKCSNCESVFEFLVTVHGKTNILREGEFKK